MVVVVVLCAHKPILKNRRQYYFRELFPIFCSIFEAKMKQLRPKLHIHVPNNKKWHSIDRNWPTNVKEKKPIFVYMYSARFFSSAFCLFGVVCVVVCFCIKQQQAQRLFVCLSFQSNRHIHQCSWTQVYTVVAPSADIVMKSPRHL